MKTRIYQEILTDPSYIPAEGEEPLKVEGVYISPEYVSDEEQKKLEALLKEANDLINS